MYRVLVKSSNNKTVYKLELESRDKVAGVLAVGVAVLADVDYEFGEHYWLTTTVDVSEYRLLKDVTEIVNYTDKLDPGSYGIWLKGSERFRSSLFTFTSEDFLEGIVWFCELFDLDYRNYIQNLPFDSFGNVYSVLGNPLPLQQEAEDAPDLDDIDREEAGDENILTPISVDIGITRDV